MPWISVTRFLDLVHDHLVPAGLDEGRWDSADVAGAVPWIIAGAPVLG